MTLLRWSLGYLRDYRWRVASLAAGHLITRDLRERLFEHLQALGLCHHSRMPVGHSVYHLETGAGGFEQLLPTDRT